MDPNRPNEDNNSWHWWNLFWPRDKDASNPPPGPPNASTLEAATGSRSRSDQTVVSKSSKITQTQSVVKNEVMIGSDHKFHSDQAVDITSIGGNTKRPSTESQLQGQRSAKDKHSIQTQPPVNSNEKKKARGLGLGLRRNKLKNDPANNDATVKEKGGRDDPSVLNQGKGHVHTEPSVLEKEKMKKKPTDEGELDVNKIFQIKNEAPFYGEAEEAPYGFIILCFFRMFWGIVGTVQVAILRLLRVDSMHFLVIDMGFNHRSQWYMITGAVLATLGGALGPVGIFKDIEFLLDVQGPLQWIGISFCLASGIVAQGGWSEPTLSNYYRLFEAVNIYRQDPNYLRDGFPGVQPDIWDQMQKQLKCCGIHNITDWIEYTPFPQVPLSCCRDDSLHCEETLRNWSVGKVTADDLLKGLPEINSLLYVDSCIKVLAVERKNHILDWTVYPLIYLAFDFLMIIKVNYLSQMVRNEYQSIAGRIRLAHFRGLRREELKVRMKLVFWSLLCCNKKGKAAAKKELELLYATPPPSSDDEDVGLNTEGMAIPQHRSRGKVGLDSVQLDGNVRHLLKTKITPKVTASRFVTRISRKVAPEVSKSRLKSK